MPAPCPAGQHFIIPTKKARHLKRRRAFILSELCTPAISLLLVVHFFELDIGDILTGLTLLPGV